MTCPRRTWARSCGASCGMSRRRQLDRFSFSLMKGRCFCSGFFLWVFALRAEGVALCRGSAGRGMWGWPAGLQCWRSRLRRDSLAMLASRWGRITHSAAFGRCVQTDAASQLTKHALRACPPRRCASQRQQGARPATPTSLVRPAGGGQRRGNGEGWWMVAIPSQQKLQSLAEPSIIKASSAGST
jgi:hypothetical protein